MTLQVQEASTPTVNATLLNFLTLLTSNRVMCVRFKMEAMKWRGSILLKELFQERLTMLVCEEEMQFYPAPKSLFFTKCAL